MYRKDRKEEPYTKRAKKEGYPARSVYKLKEIDEKYKIIKKGDNVLDLGCCPGSWLLYVSERIGDKGKTLGVDIKDAKIAAERNIFFLKKDIGSLEGSDFKAFGGKKCQVVLSDAMSKTTGIKSVDVASSFEVSRTALGICRKVLSKGGNFVCKMFESEFSQEFLEEVSLHFNFVKTFRPKAVVKGSREFYVIAKKFKTETQK